LTARPVAGHDPTLREVLIARSPNRRTDPASWDRRLTDVGRAAAAWFTETLSQARPPVRRVGVLWGKTVKAFVDHVEALEPAARGAGPRVEVVPLAGQPYYHEEEANPVELAATHLAARLAAALNGAGGRQIDLPIPACIPVDFAEPERETLWRFFRSLPSYRRVFGASERGEGLADDLDAIVTSCGSASLDYADPWLEARASAEGVSRERWQELVVGDMGGLVFGAGRGDDGKAEAMNRRWLGAQKRHFAKCARAAARSAGSRPGVVLIAHGRSKAPVVLRAIREQLVNTLVIDDDCASALEKQVKTCA
jgi:DNA-binding transcriptional regulator LsrR (DeoR family)